MAEAQKKKTTDLMQIKLVFHGPGGKRVEVRRFEVEGKPTITSIKVKACGRDPPRIRGGGASLQGVQRCISPQVLT